MRETARLVTAVILTIAIGLAGTTAAAAVASQDKTADPSVVVSAPPTAEPGETIQIVLQGEGASSLSISGETGGWVVESVQPSGILSSPTPSQIPYVSGPDTVWGYVYNSGGDNTFIINVTAPRSLGTRNFTAAAANETVSTTDFSIDVQRDQSDGTDSGGNDGGDDDTRDDPADVAGITVDAPRTLAPSSQTTIVINGSEVGSLNVGGDVGNWTVLSTTPSGLTTVPNPADLPYVSADGDIWGTLFPAVGENSFAVTVKAPATTGLYQFDASAGDGPVQQFAINVTDDIHESGVAMPLWTQATGGDGELSRPDMVGVLERYFSGDDLRRETVLALVKYYVAK